jgi:Domain of unknown function (DUF4145)
VKDSPEVIKFSVLFSRLKEWCDDDPGCLVDLSRKDDSIDKLCDELETVACILELHDNNRQENFTAPVDPKFISLLRDYEVRYAQPLAHIWLSKIVPELDDLEQSTLSKANFGWQVADEEAEEKSKSIVKVIKFSQEQIKQGWRDFPEGFYEEIERGISTWINLLKTDFHLRGVLRRRDLIPSVLVPRNVASKVGSAEKLSLFTNLKQAHDAFKFGAPLAALALMRSIMETMLRDHYKIKGENLYKRIKNTHDRFPARANKAALERLRTLANDVLHLNSTSESPLKKMTDEKLEKEICYLLLVLRDLIEGVE